MAAKGDHPDPATCGLPCDDRNINRLLQPHLLCGNSGLRITFREFIRLGAYYHRHLDQFRGNGNRHLHLHPVYLNVGWKPNDGGILRLYIPENGQESIVDVTPTAGKLVCFKSDAIPHEVLATNAMRYSITGWWLAREKQLSFLD
jgi:Rps23 Pro-64 3,4-dihydroxylase Tpa1-like proline 4-hydroxylase